ncbi:hypothetical protein R1sor_008093 [Riccia sorocarpa]|uniref:Dirigent protein n=1 Tax=Riccia sorocarpa TaxID=122646 RepID=A0ABD3HSD0_9MARC
MGIHLAPERAEQCRLLVLQVSLTLFALCSIYLTVDAAGYGDYPYNYEPAELPKPDFEFTFYMQSRIGSPTNSTTAAVTLPVDRVGQVNLTDQSWFQPNTSLFGTIGVFENPLTLESLSNSTEVGFGRGIYVFDSKFDPAFAPAGSNGVEWLWTGIFNDDSGLGNSTLCFKGWNLPRDAAKGTSEVAICGGTGKFRLAQGYAKLSRAISGPTAVSLKHDVAIFIKA